MDAERIIAEWKDSTERYGAALTLFGMYLHRARKLENEIEDMTDMRKQLPEKDVVNKKLYEYAELMSKVADVDDALHSLYDRCLRCLDAAYEATAALRLPSLMLAFSNAKQQLADSLYDTR